MAIMLVFFAFQPGCDGGDDASPNGDPTSTSSAATGDDSLAAAEDGAGPAMADCSCEGKVCGDDGCGVSCGTCDGDTAFCFSGACQTEESCPGVDFTVGTQAAYRMDDKGKERLRYEAVVEGSQFTKIEIVSNRVIEEIGSLSVGTHTLNVENLTDCGDVCVVGHMERNKAECAFA